MKEKLDEFLEKYPLRQPDDSKINEADEKYPISSKNGLRLLDRAPASWGVVSSPPESWPEYEDHKKRYLWVIDSRGVPCLYEYCEASSALTSGRAKHTNLTGGKSASSGGELYFRSDTEIFVSSASGRYAPRTVDEIRDAALFLKEYGYVVCSFGWDEEQGVPSRFYREGEAKWL